VNLTRSHDWAARRLLAYSVGLLAGDQMLDLEQHLRSCTECRARLASLRPPAGAEPGHLPASLVATWPRSSRLLAGLERELVARHLHACELCRASLEFAGHDPAFAAPPAPVARARAARPWAAWIGLLVVLGTIAGGAAWLVSRRPDAVRDGVRGLLASGASTAETRVAFEWAVDSLAPGAVRLPQPGFGGPGPRVLDVGAVTSVSGLVLVLPPALQPPSAEAGQRRVTVTLFRDGRPVATRQDRFFALGDAIRLRPEGRLAEGEYDLRFAIAPREVTGRAIVWTFRLQVR